MRISGAIDLDAPVLNYARTDFPLLEADASVEKALEKIRREGVGERVIYFYAIDEQKRLVGVVPTRRLLTTPIETCLREIMVAACDRVAGGSNRPGSVRIFCALQISGVPNHRFRAARDRYRGFRCFYGKRARKRRGRTGRRARRFFRGAGVSSCSRPGRIGLAHVPVSISMAGRDCDDGDSCARCSQGFLKRRWLTVW